jgi:hypothetical protein
MLGILAQLDWDPDVIVTFGSIILIVFVVALFRFLRARMRHKEVLAAIEKGVAIPDLSTSKPRIPRGITNIALGIALIVLSPAFIFQPTLIWGWGSAFPSLVCFSIGLFCLIRGLMLRKHEKDNQPPKAAERTNQQ